MRLLGLLGRGRKIVADVTVVGWGLPAGAVALEMARRGRRVRVLRPAGGEGRGAGLGIVASGPPAPYERVSRWLGREAARAVWAAGRENLSQVRGFLAATSDGCGHNGRGSFLLGASRREAESLAESEEMLREDGFPGEFLDHYMLETHFDVSGFPGAYWAADDAELDPAALAAAVDAAASAAGVVFGSPRVQCVDAGSSGATVETDEGPVSAPWVAVATDSEACRLLPDLRPLLGPAAPQRRRFVPEAGTSLPSAARTADGRLAWQAGTNGITLAATGPPSEREGDALDEMAVRLHAAPGRDQRWTESGEISSDGLPVVGTVAGRAIGVACGFGPFAASLAFAAAHWLGRAVVDGRDPTPPPLRVGRKPVGVGAV